MPSFDLISEVSIQEVDNAVNQTQKEIDSRYDFKGKKYGLSLDKKTIEVKLSADSEQHLLSMVDILSSKFLKRGLDLGCLDIAKIQPIGGMMLAQTIKVKQGIETDLAKKINKSIKDMKFKIDTQIQDKQIRISAKKIDDLQEVIAFLKSKQSEFKISFQFVNMKS